MAMKKIAVEKAVGMVIPHDLTQIVQGKKKGPAFKKGHIIRESDIPVLKDIGKYNIYVLELGADEVHEDNAARLLAEAVAGENITYDDSPVEGKVSFRSEINGILRVNEKALYEFNLLGDVMVATLHQDMVVERGMQVAAGRAIPLVIKKDVLDKAVNIARGTGGLVHVSPWILKRAAIVVTGREVFEGRIEDKFGPAMKRKLEDYGLEVASVRKAPDDEARIAEEVSACLAEGAQLILCTGGMSVDPDDVTRGAIARAGAEEMVYGTPVLPGAMFLVSYLNGVPVLGIPACGMFFKTTVLDLVLPKVLAGDKIDRAFLARLGHGGLCMNCKKCRFPVCPFGKN